LVFENTYWGMWFDIFTPGLAFYSSGLVWAQIQAWNTAAMY